MARKKQSENGQMNIVSEILTNRYRLKCKNQKQKEFANLITDYEIVFASGPAGVGKSYIAIGRAIELLQNSSNSYKKIMLINPAVDAEERYGFVPGTIREKLDPYVGSSMDKIIGSSNRIKLEESGVLVVGALGHIRGKSIDNTVLVMEEAQNMSPNQMKTLITRIGYGSKFIISGDLDQSDRYNDYKKSGLYDGITRHKNISSLGFIEFNENEIVRNPLIQVILNNYKKVEIPKPPNPRLLLEGAKPYIKPNTKKHKLRLVRRIKIWFKKNFKW
jgi:phosphate starvation-inducible PhoH-like protein